mmetsp:Transcript_15875/g.30780  ORF Transcript_15875/g.30780 Transcript_15875/m.30780 type:complete len:663 (-) Transcript_15875:105-2093(-)
MMVPMGEPPSHSSEHMSLAMTAVLAEASPLIEPDQLEAHPPNRVDSEAPCSSLEAAFVEVWPLVEPDQLEGHPPNMAESEAPCSSLEDLGPLVEPDQPQTFEQHTTELQTTCMSLDRPPLVEPNQPETQRVQTVEFEVACMSLEDRPSLGESKQPETQLPQTAKSEAACASLEAKTLPAVEEPEQPEAGLLHAAQSGALCLSLEEPPRDAACQSEAAAGDDCQVFPEKALDETVDPHKQEVVEMQEQLLYESLEDITFGAGSGASVEAELYDGLVCEQEAWQVEAHHNSAVEQDAPVEACNGQAELPGLPPIFEEDQQCHVSTETTTQAQPMLMNFVRVSGPDCNSGSSTSSASSVARKQRRTNRSLLARRCAEAGTSIAEPCTDASEWAVYLMREVDRLSRRLEAMETETLPTFQRSAFEAIRVQDARLSSWSGTAASAISLLGEENNFRRMEIEALNERLRSSVSGLDPGRALRPPCPDSPPWRLLPEEEVERLVAVARQAATEAVAEEADRFASSLSSQANGLMQELNGQQSEVVAMLERVTQETNSLRELQQECLSNFQNDPRDSVAEEGTAANIRKALQVRIGRVGDEETTFPAKPRPTRLRVPNSPQQDQLAQDVASTLAAVERSASFRSLVRAEVQQVCKELQSMDSMEISPKPW